MMKPESELEKPEEVDDDYIDLPLEIGLLRVGGCLYGTRDERKLNVMFDVLQINLGPSLFGIGYNTDDGWSVSILWHQFNGEVRDD